MSDIKLNNDGDIDITNNAVRLTSGKDAIAQHLQSRYRTFLGEWFLNTEVGVPYYQEFFTKQVNFNIIQGELKAAAVETPGVIELVDFDFDFDYTRRVFTVNLSVNTIEGEINFSQIMEI